jgi:MFS transporter, CP family, cyanate transporter
VTWTDRRLALAGLGFAALALRLQLTGIGPLLPAIQSDLGISHTVAGLLPAIPVICMGLFAPPAPHLARRLGTRIGIAVCLAGIVAFGFARAAVPGAALVVALTVPIGIAMGLAGTLLPMAVKERFSERAVVATGVYAVGLVMGSAIAAAAAVPFADAFGGWRGSLAAFSVLAAALLATWLLSTRGTPGHVRALERPPQLPWRSGIGWALALVYGLDSLVFYGLASWLPAAYVERGWSEASAGGLVAVMQFANLPALLVVPFLAERHGSRRSFLLAGAGLLVVATLGFVLVPGAGYVWATLAGAALGMLFPIVLALPLDLAREPGEVGSLAALMLGGGYVIAAAAPLALGAVRDATGSFTTSLWLLAGISAALVVSCLPFSRRRLARGAVPAAP